MYYGQVRWGPNDFIAAWMMRILRTHGSCAQLFLAFELSLYVLIVSQEKWFPMDFVNKFQWF